MTTVNALVQGILLGGLFALFACGLSLMFGVMDVINLAHGDIAVAAVYLAVVLIPASHISALWIFVLVVPIFMVGGYILQRLLIQRSLDSGAVTTLLVTFGLSVVLENGLLEAFTANSQSLNIGSLVSGSFQISNQIYVPYLSLIILGAALVALTALQIFLARTRTGRMVRAMSDDRETAQLMGANYRHLFGIATGLAFGTVALAGLALGMYTSVGPPPGRPTCFMVSPPWSSAGWDHYGGHWSEEWSWGWPPRWGRWWTRTSGPWRRTLCSWSYWPCGRVAFSPRRLRYDG